MISADLELARRLEQAEAFLAAGCAKEASVIEVAGGSAIFAGVGSPLTHAVGLGMRGRVLPEELDRLEAFYRAKETGVTVDVCPLADPSLVELLGQRGYRVTEFNNVLVRVVAPGEELPAGSPVRPAGAEEGPLWERTVARGFLEKDTLNDEELAVGAAIWQMSGALHYLAFAGNDAVAAAAMAVHGGVANLFADSTIVGFRGVGLHGALIRERLRAAASAGCDLATAATLPGSTSQRNYERQGFRIAYTKAILTRM